MPRPPVAGSSDGSEFARSHCFVGYCIPPLGGAIRRSCVCSTDDRRGFTLSLRYYRDADYRSSHANIDVMRSRNESALYPICFFWSTIVMNVLTADEIISAYLTHIQQHVAFCSRTIEGIQLAAKVNYHERGFTLYDGSQPSCHRWSCPKRTRFFFDDGCLNIAFDSMGIHSRTGVGLLAHE
ncbi:uncharacterized protein LAESUDRAFT_381085 [Laetiporus sulphureus 93-53]|uniref:Uncharacterized protein n=1 Tax=Laetiporus sulphureus 93-53 TaxID=1314785 RepID=A0A165CLL5_9APHY|nr:uncharacterized protein LAESUDRAFT_381085 [Laetiporus sulphureus 93-53]KZT03029.1 hypothetical protein LAESUDRAFT_381085 [Laetiporus sulphureus 93-53]